MVSQRFATTLPTYEYTCSPCGQSTTFEYDGGFHKGNGWDEPGEGPDYFGIVGDRQCLTAAHVVQEVCDQEDICTVDASTFDQNAYDAFGDWWWDNYREAQYMRRYNG